MADTPLATDDAAEKSGFNYCFWSKLLVAIVLFPLVAFIAASLVQGVALKFAAAFTANALLVALAIKVDRLPFLSGKMPCLIGGRKSCK